MKIGIWYVIVNGEVYGEFTEEDKAVDCFNDITTTDEYSFLSDIDLVRVLATNRDNVLNNKKIDNIGNVLVDENGKRLVNLNQ